MTSEKNQLIMSMSLTIAKSLYDVDRSLIVTRTTTAFLRNLKIIFFHKLQFNCFVELIMNSMSLKIAFNI